MTTCDVHRRLGERRPATAGIRVEPYIVNLCAPCGDNARREGHRTFRLTSPRSKGA